ncbi:Glycosyl transferase family 2 [Halorhabdus sp. SVX81]|uniref:glycosyltransferase family 2 protein n=1 Tax=Halorhabdus sp. SVX81 TaxID=2978283 RepID=UPI0023DBB4EF|nr:glycosyltransferase family 2 protein [Halorhabdus sp. SVX81]WEL18569.1 Glycosyl transferase family 2 [Halorhabdus sp. SVX81]
MWLLDTFLPVIGITFLVVICGSYLLIHLAAVIRMRKQVTGRAWEPVYDVLEDPLVPDIAVFVPAYNEETVIVESVRSFLNLNYPNFEIVVVNDGSTDGTLAVLDEEFSLTELEVPPMLSDAPCEPVHGVYQSNAVENLRVVDKENGGKGDAHNAGIWLTDSELFCIVDADTIIQPTCLANMVRPFLEHPDEMVAVGGPIRVANGSTIDEGLMTRPKLPSNLLAGLQQVEYIRAFYSGRLGLDQLRSLILISGAFGLFRTDLVREMGGYDEDSIVEDIEFTVRLHRHLIDRDRPYRVGYLLHPLVYTQVPEDIATLANQRRRWFRGLVETMVKHYDAMFDRQYGRIGMFALPFFCIGEGIGRILEAIGYLLLPVMLAVGVVSLKPILFVFVGTMFFGVLLTWISIFTEVWSSGQYGHPRQVLKLMGLAVVEFIGYRQWRTFVAVQGLFEYVRGENSWGEMERSTLNTD